MSRRPPANRDAGGRRLSFAYGASEPLMTAAATAATLGLQQPRWRALPLMTSRVRASLAIAALSLSLGSAFVPASATTPLHTSDVSARATSAIDRVSSISCATRAFCVAVDPQGEAVAFDGRHWGLPLEVDPGRGLVPVSCASTTSCVAVAGDGSAYTFDGASWSTPVSIDPSGGLLSSISCASRHFCVAVDLTGDGVVYQGSGWEAPVLMDQEVGVMSISCPSVTTCSAVDYNGYGVMYDGDRWSRPRRLGS